ncbi:MAG: transcription elongation factor GreA [Candidatus Pacebacteria bacterium]|nr:transcription elongation factor GreA [Candidatus Paceibacterota bacterium]
MAASYFLSKEAYAEFERELKNLMGKKRKEISERLEESISLGDISENAEYQEAKDAQLMNERRIAELEDILSRASIVSRSNEEKNKVGLGCLVVLKKDGEKESCEYSIVGSEEADPSQRKISDESPLGNALLGKAKGGKAEVLTPGGKVEYTIMDIK